MEGKPKAESLREAIRSLNSSVQVQVILQRLTQYNVLEIIADYDIVLDCTDNVLTRYVINDACAVSRKPLVSGAAIGICTVYVLVGALMMVPRLGWTDYCLLCFERLSLLSMYLS